MLIKCATAAIMCGQAAMASINVPSDGSDGALVISANTVIDLSQAVNANWEANNSGGNAGKGVYDAAKWAVVFKYSSVTVNAGATLTFKNHASRAPVVWLVKGDVTINGTVSLDGQASVPPPALAEPGPGGFRGGAGNYAPGATDAAGFGPGGGGVNIGDSYGPFGAAGSYGSVGYGGRPAYGNPSLIPLIGGSGGGGRERNYTSDPKSGGGGGGAILIASTGVLSINGSVLANGGSGNRNSNAAYDYANGSGGGIRLVAETLAGSGIVQTMGGTGVFNGGLGRIRLERTLNTSSLQVTPDPSVVPLLNGDTPQIWPPAGSPTVKIVSIGSQIAPTDPRAEFGVIGADVTLPQVTTTPVIVETSNVERASAVTVRVTPRSDGNFTETTATVSATVSENPLVLRWTANVPVKNGYAAMQVKVVRP